MTNKEIKSWVDKLSKYVQKALDNGATLSPTGTDVKLNSSKRVCLLTAVAASSKKDRENYVSSYSGLAQKKLNLTNQEIYELELGFMCQRYNKTDFQLIGSKVAKRFMNKGLYKPTS